MPSDPASAPPEAFDTHPLWRFSVGLYGHVQVRTACLALQDDHGIDVNMVLACLWQERRGAAPLTTRDIRTLLAASQRARDCVGAIRRVRRSVGETARDSALHRTLRHAELLAENVVQGALYRALPATTETTVSRGLASLQAYAADAGLDLPMVHVQPLLDTDAPT